MRNHPPMSAPKPTAMTVIWTATGCEPPVFLDERGRRRRWVLCAGAFAALASGLWLAALLAGAIGFSKLPPAAIAPHLLARGQRVVARARPARHPHLRLASTPRPPLGRARAVIE